MKRIHDSLARTLERHRLVFWYDAEGEWGESFDAYPGEGVVKLRVANNEFGTKVQIVRHPEERFLAYILGPRPADAENWLLDLLLQGHEYRADRTSLALQDAGLTEDFRPLVDEHAAFFNNVKRVEALKQLVTSEDTPGDVRLKMMAAIAGTDPDVLSLTLHFLGRGGRSDLMDPVAELLDTASLAPHFWDHVKRVFGYDSSTPGLRDFGVTLFRAANPIDGQVKLRPTAWVFMKRWKDSQAHQQSYRSWAKTMEGELQVLPALEGLEKRDKIGDNDTFEAFEKYVLHGLAASFHAGAAAGTIRGGVQQRRGSFWWNDHADGYEAIENAATLRELLAAVDLAIESPAAGATKYVKSWWQLDAAYRRCMYHLRRYNQVQAMAPVQEWVESRYVNDFLLPLADRWSDQVGRLDRWECAGLPSQRQFFERWVAPFVTRGQKLFVIISDALRFEAAAEYAERLQSANRWTAELEPMFGSLPSYTQLGMASLLPGRDLALDADTGNVSVDGRAAAGTANRDGILGQACGGKGRAIQAEKFLELNTKTDGRALMKDYDVIYIYHNQIDNIGDAPGTEAQTTEAVAKTFDTLDEILRKIANINGTNMLLTADHGFLFQQEPLTEGDMVPLPADGEWTFRGRRFCLGRRVPATAGVKTFTAEALGLNGDWTAAFPLALGRFPLQGSGKRFVHGGISLQEVILPVVKIHKARSDDTDKVDVNVLRAPGRITTGQISIGLFQDQPAVEKVLPRTLRIGIFAKDGTPLSEQKTVTFDSKESEARLRETTIGMVLGGAADAHNNSDVELRLEETVDGTNQWVIYRKFDVRLQKTFTGDFDDL